MPVTSQAECRSHAALCSYADNSPGKSLPTDASGGPKRNIGCAFRKGDLAARQEKELAFSVLANSPTKLEGCRSIPEWPATENVIARRKACAQAAPQSATMFVHIAAFAKRASGVRSAVPSSGATELWPERCVKREPPLLAAEPTVDTGADSRQRHTLSPWSLSSNEGSGVAPVGFTSAGHFELSNQRLRCESPADGSSIQSRIADGEITRRVGSCGLKVPAVVTLSPSINIVFANSLASLSVGNVFVCRR